MFFKVSCDTIGLYRCGEPRDYCAYLIHRVKIIVDLIQLVNRFKATFGELNQLCAIMPKRSVITVNFSDKILDYFSANNIQPSTVAKATGIDKSTFSKWKSKPTSKLDFETVYKIVSYLNISIDYLLTGSEINQLNKLDSSQQRLLECYENLPEQEKQRLIGRAEMLVDLFGKKSDKTSPPIVMTTINIADVAAGAGVSTPFTINNAFSPKQIPRDHVPARADCGVPINGDSMEPNYPNGSIAWVKITQDVEYGDVVIAILNGEPYCKIYQSDGLHSLNENYDTIHVYEQDNFSVFGKVIGYYEA